MDFATWKKTGKTFPHRGHNIFYQDLGKGPVLLLIHGFPTASWDWVSVLDALTRQYRVIAPDMIGFGFSPKPAFYDYSIFDQADLLESLLAARGVSEVGIIAHDYGDTVAQELLARHEDRLESGSDGLTVRGVCLLNGGLFPEAHRPLMTQKLLAGPFGKLTGKFAGPATFAASFRKIFGPKTPPSDELIEQCYELASYNNGRRIMHKLIGYMDERRDNRDRWVGALQHTEVPLKLINGLDDPISGRHMVDRYRELVSQQDITGLQGIGHYPQCEYPDAVGRSIVEFLSRCLPVSEAAA